MKTLLALLLLVSATQAQTPTAAELELLGTLDTLDAQVIGLPDTTEREAIEEAAAVLRQAIIDLPDEPPPPPPPPPPPECLVTGQPHCNCATDPLVQTVRDGQTLNVNTVIRDRTLCVRKGGTLNLLPGADVMVADVPIDPTVDPEQLGNGLIIHGTINAHGTPRTRIVRLTAPLGAGQTTLELASEPVGWQPGDEIVIPDTRQKVAKNKIDLSSQTEVVRVLAVTGATVTITPTTYAHGACALDGTLTPHVANLTCDIVIRSENPFGTRGHVMAMAGSTVRFSHVEFRDLGRTDKSRPLDSAVQLPDGTWDIGTNQIGRYPLHLHLMGETDAIAEGCVIRGSPGWAVAVHGTHGSNIVGTVAYDIFGSAFMAEDGTERSSFRDNFAVRIRDGRNPGARGGVVKLSATVTDTGYDGSGFWFRGPGNNVTGNVAADCQFAGYNWNGYYNGTSFQAPGETRDNEGYNCNELAWLTWSQSGGQINNWHPTTFEDFTGWHIHGKGVESWHEAKHTFRSFRLLNDPAISSKSESATNTAGRHTMGFWFGGDTYENGGHVVEDCDVRGFNVGIYVPTDLRGGGDFIVRDTRLANYINVRATPASDNVPRVVTLERVTFEPSGITAIPYFPPSELDVWMNFNTARPQLGPVRLLDSGETVYFREDGTAPCMTERERIFGYVCED